MTFKNPAFFLLTVIASVAFLFGCSSSKGSSSSNAGSTNGGSVGAAAGAAASSSTSSGGSGSIQDVTITAKEYSFDMPDSLNPGLTRIKFVNSGKQEHTAQLVRLNPGATPAQLTAALQDEQNPQGVFKVITAAGGVNATAGGKDNTAYANLTPGSYYVISFGGDENSPPDFAQGMLKAFTVKTGTAPEATPPTTQGKVTLADYNFLGVDSLKAGTSTLQVLNGGPQTHEMYVVRLPNGYTADQLKSDIAAEANGGTPPPNTPAIEDAGGIGALAVNTTGYVTLNLTAGHYAFLCFIPDINKGVPHASLGMVKGITVQ
jgi:plastocyanin